MEFIQTLAVALALAVDATVFAFSYGLTQTNNRFKSAFQLALCTGFFQGLMPLIGYRGGSRVREWVGAWDHWIVFFTFGWLGISIIMKSFHDEEEKIETETLGVKALLMVGIATSIDALAIGVCLALDSLGCIEASCRLSSIICTIAGVTFLCTLCGFYASLIFKKLPVHRLEQLAGLILIALGSHTLFTHIAEAV